MSEKQAGNAPATHMQEPDLISEMGDLKREMRSARIAAWIESNQKTLMIAVVLLLAALVVGAFWIESNKSERAAVATIYQHAVSASDVETEKSLLNGIVRDYGSSSYAALALLHLSGIDTAHREAHLKALIEHPAAMQEWIWQARLDLAEIELEKGDKASAMKELQKSVGKQYQQLRHYLMAEASDSVEAKKKHLQKALDSASVDEALKQKIELLLSRLNA